MSALASPIGHLDEPAIGGWVAGACLSLAALMMLAAIVVQEQRWIADLWASSAPVNTATQTTAELIEPVYVERQSLPTTPTSTASTVPSDSTAESDSTALASNNVTSGVELNTAGTNLEDQLPNTAEPERLVLPLPEPETEPAVEPVIANVQSAADDNLEAVVPEAPINVEASPSIAAVPSEPAEPIDPVDIQESAEPEVATANTAALTPATPATSTGTSNSLAALRRTVLGAMTERSKRVSFVAGRADLTPRSEALLQQIFEDLFLYSESLIVVEVASNDARPGNSNRVLSEERARTIRTFLNDRGLEQSRLISSVLPQVTEPGRNQYVNIQANLDE